MECLEFLLILILVIYIGLMIKKKFHKEGFNSNMNHYKDAYILTSTMTFIVSYMMIFFTMKSIIKFYVII